MNFLVSRRRDKTLFWLEVGPVPRRVIFVKRDADAVFLDVVFALSDDNFAVQLRELESVIGAIEPINSQVHHVVGTNFLKVASDLVLVETADAVDA